MGRIFCIVLSNVIATSALAEADTVSCNTARAIHVSYKIDMVDGAGNDNSGSRCLLFDEDMNVSAGPFGVGLRVSLPKGGEATLLVTRAASGDVYFGTTNFSFKWMTDGGLEALDDKGSDAHLRLGFRTDRSSGKAIFIPLRSRHVYSPEKDGHWQYTPLQVDYWGQLIVRLGNPDVGMAPDEADL